MNDRNCEECKHKTKNGCESWDCHFEPKGLTKEEVEHYSKLAEHYDRKAVSK